MKYWISVLLFATTWQYINTQEAERTSTTYGSDFFIGFMQNLNGFTFGTLQLTIGTPSAIGVPFEVVNGVEVIDDGTVTTNNPVTVNVHSDLQVFNGDFSNRHKGIHIRSTNGEPLYVVAENSLSFVNHGAFMAYPCFSLGEDVDEYMYGVVSVDDVTDALDSQVLLVGCEDDTVITITPSQSISLPMDSQMVSESVAVEPDALSHEIILHRMQTLLISSVDDLTGTTIASNKPLTVISGHECANVPLSEAGCEPFAVQVPPIATWGTRFLLAPFVGRSGPHGFKAVSSSDTSFVYTCNSESRFAPETRVLDFFTDSYCFLQSSDPIFVTELSFGGTIDDMGDPAIAMVSPIDQYVQTVDFVSLSSSNFPSSYISVTVAAEHHDPDSVLLDGQAIQCNWEEITDNEDNIVGYGCSKTITSAPNGPTKHTVTHSAEGGLLSVLVYGFNSFPNLGYSYLTGQVVEVSEDGGEDIDFEVNLLPFLDLTTFPGVLELDNTVEDSTSDPIVIPNGLIFGKEIATLAYVNENGVISFNQPWKFSVPDRFPTEYFWTRTGMAVAPFWSDNDIRKEGAVRYASYHTSEAATNPEGKQWLDQVNEFIQNFQSEDEEEFQGSWLLTVHWDSVHPSPHGEDDHRGISEEDLDKANSYQATIVSNTIRTYAIFSYKCGEVQWSSLGRNRAAAVGYNSEADFFDNHPLSGISGIGDAVSCTFNIGKRRKRQAFGDPNTVAMELPGDQVVTAAVRQCLDLVHRDRFLFVFPDPLLDTPEELATLLDPCPCHLSQAINDRARFIPLDEPANCFVSARPILPVFPRQGEIALTQMCCYVNGALHTSSSEGFAGTMLRYHPIFNQPQYQVFDESLRSACCEIGFDDQYYCGLYFAERPINECNDYRPPTQGRGYGDPWYRTFDGRGYAFQGHSSEKYLILKILPEDGDPDTEVFTVEGEFRQWPHPLVGATNHGRLAFGQPEYSFEIGGELKVFQTRPEVEDITSQLENGNSLQEQFDNHVDITTAVSTNSYKRRWFYFYDYGIALDTQHFLTAGNYFINFYIYVPEKYRERTQGFLGNFDGDSTNEFHTRLDTVPIPNINTGPEIFTHLQQNWILSEDDVNLFRPTPEGKRKRQVDQPLPPIFFEDLNITDEVRMACEGNPACMFDLTITGNMEVAMETLNHDEEGNMTIATITNFPPNISADPIYSLTLGQESAHTITVVDPGDEFTLTILGGLPPNSELEDVGEGEYIFRWNLQEVTYRTLTFVANDSQGASSTYVPVVEICACSNGGTCTRDGLLTGNATVVLNCMCSEAFSGTFCEEDRNGCSEIQCFEGVECMDIPAPGVGAVCGSCPDGYTGDATKCYDIDECLTGTALCDQTCENTDGSFECSCFEGYELTPEDTCQDINECEELNDCQQLCENSQGSYSCSCMDGFTLNEDGRNCTADVPCDGACSYECAVIGGEEQCYCPAGFELLLPQATDCVDINECDQSPCDQLCINNEGSFECSCEDGYALQENGRKCTDIDECFFAATTGVDLCEDDGNSQCVNREGTFVCECVPGYEQINGTCSRIVNEPPPPPPPVVTPTNGAENSANYTAPNLTPESFTPALQQRFRDITARVISLYCAELVCSVVRPDRDIEELANVVVEPVNIAIPVSLIGQNDDGELMFTFYVQLSDSFLSKENVELAVQQIEVQEQYRDGGFLLPLPTTAEEPTTLATTEEPTTLATTEEPIATTEEPITCPPLCNPEFCSDFFTRRSLCTIPNPANSDCSAPCRITFCHTCYYADEDRPLPGACDSCPYYPQEINANEKCFKRWAVCVRRADGALYPKVRKQDRTPERFRCYEHPCPLE